MCFLYDFVKSLFAVQPLLDCAVASSDFACIYTLDSHTCNKLFIKNRLQFHRQCMLMQIDEEQWWDIDREEVPPDRQVFQDFNQ